MYLNTIDWNDMVWSAGRLWVSCVFSHCSWARVQEGSKGIHGPDSRSPVTNGVHLGAACFLLLNSIAGKIHHVPARGADAG